MRHRIGFVCGALAFVVLFARATGCASSGPAECVAAGGQCFGGGSWCLNRGPQDCNPNANPGGAYCCLMPCPAEPPMTGSACTADGGECVYQTTTNASGSAQCYCQSGAWNCPDVPGVDAAGGSDATDANDAAAE